MRFCLLSGTVILLAVHALAEDNPSPDAKPATAVATRLKSELLPNALQIHKHVISGGLPEGDAAFKELKALGIKTIISVDGQKPDVERARRFGLRYVHLPHGYDGISDERARELAKAVHDLPGPIYIHCHHGKHRSPAAATVACVATGLLAPESALKVLQIAGTSKNYRGLYQSAEEARPLEASELTGPTPEFPEAVAVPPLAEAMVALEHTHDHLKQIARVGWKSPPNHPDLDPAHEALLLREHFTELLRTEQVARQLAEFRELLADDEKTAASLETALQSLASDPKSAKAASERADELFKRLTQGCATCHQKFRDVPLREKNR